MWGRGLIGSNGTCSTLCQFAVTPSTTHNQTGPFWCCFLNGWVCVRSRPPWVSPMNCPVRLGVSPAAASTPTSIFSQWFEALFPCAGALGCTVCHLVQPMPCSESSLPSCPSLPLLPVWMNVSSLSPWLSDFLTVRFSVSSGCFLFLNCCCPSVGCGRRCSVSTYASILAGRLETILESTDSGAPPSEILIQ